MRRLSAFSASTAVAVVAAIVAVVAVMFPGLGFGQTTSSHGGPPTDVYMQTHPDTCVTVGLNSKNVLLQDFTLNQESHVLVYFSLEWGRLRPGEDGHVSIHLDGGGPFDGIEPWRFGGTQAGNTAGTVMWAFDHVPAGGHSVETDARVSLGGSDTASADVNDCALTVIVTPVA